MKRLDKTAGLAFVLALAFLAGCRTPNVKERLKDADETSRRIKEETSSWLATNTTPLKLETALGLARERSLKLAQAKLDAQVASIQHATAFSAFLPQVNATFRRQATDEELGTTLMGRKVPLVDHQYLNTASISLTQPLFTPNAWLLFVESKYVTRAQDLKLERTKQLLDVQVSALFYQAAVAEELVKTYRAQLDASQKLSDQISALAKEGYALEPERERIKARLANDRFGLARAQDSKILTRARLAEILRFWPGEANLSVDGASMTNVLSRPWLVRAQDGAVTNLPPDQGRALGLTEMLWQTLLNRKELWIGDQTIIARRTEVLRALTGFLPELYGTASDNYISQTGFFPASFWMGGFTAAMSVFKGFQTVNEYRKARAEKETEYLLQEDRALSLLTAVVEAHQSWTQSFERKLVADQALKAASMDYDATQARYRQEQETLSDVLDKLSTLETARVNAVSAAYASALAEIVLRDAIGIGMEKEEKENHEQ